MWLVRSTWALVIVGIVVVVLELVLPVAILCTASSTSNRVRQLQTCFILLAIAYHVASEVIMDVNFVRTILLQMVALHAVWQPAHSKEEAIDPAQRTSWLCRAGFWHCR